MCRHVIRSFVIVLIALTVLGRQCGKESFQIVPNSVRSVFLDQKRRRGVPAKERQQSSRDRLTCKPRPHLLRYLHQTTAASAESQHRRDIAHGAPPLPPPASYCCAELAVKRRSVDY